MASTTTVLLLENAFDLWTTSPVERRRLLRWLCSLPYTGQSINMDLLLFAIHRSVYQYGPSALCYTQVSLSIWTFCSLLYTGQSINMDLLLFAIHRSVYQYGLLLLLLLWTFCSLLYTGQSINMDLLLFA